MDSFNNFVYTAIFMNNKHQNVGMS